MPRHTSPAAGIGLPIADPVPRPPILRHPPPDELPEQYGMVCVGDCMTPLVPDGTTLAFDKSAPYAAGDLVVFYRRLDLVDPGRAQGLVKRLFMGPPPSIRFPFRNGPWSDCAPLVIFEMLNPRRQLFVPCSDIVAMHKCIGQVDEHGHLAPLPGLEVAHGD